MHVIALAQQKGGVGKSTLAINLATAAMAKGFKAAIIDMDLGQGTVARWSERRKTLQLDYGPLVVKAEPINLDAALRTLQSSGHNFILIDLPGKSSPVIGA